MSEATQYGFYIDTAKCTGCKTCHVSCQDDNDLAKELKWRRVYEFGGHNFSKNGDGTISGGAYAYYASIGCNHCNNPACANICPVDAYSKDEETGLVQHDQEACIGCKLCASACPYDAPQFNTNTGKMTKCDGCIDRVKEGKNTICMDSCPMRAIEFGPIAELRAKYGSNADMAGLPASSVTDPNLIIKVNVNANADATVLNPNEV